MDKTLIADTVVSLAAFIGLLILILSIRRSDKNSITRRFLFGLNVIVVMLASRILEWTTGIAIFGFLTHASASLIPLATILLTEGLMRRHAPFVVKMVIAAGTLLLLALAFIPEAFVEPYRTTLLLAFQVFGFGASGYLVATRDRSALTKAENRIIDRIALSLLLIIPFMITDYRVSGYEVPVRLGGLAILGLCWLTISLERAHLNNQDMIRAFGVLVAGAVFAGLAIGWIGDFELPGIVRATFIALSAMLVAVIYNDSVTLRFDGRRNSLLRHIAEGDVATSEEFLTGLQNHVLVEGALILESADLKDFDVAMLKQAFLANPILRNTDVADGSSNTKNEDEQLHWMFERYNATHVILTNDSPLTLVALNMPALSSSPGAETELQAVQRMAWLISRTKPGK